MAGLQRSAQTFRRSGSSGLVWDERFLSEDAAENDSKDEKNGGAEEVQPELRHSRSVGAIGMMRRSHDDDKKQQKQKQKQKQKDDANGDRVFQTKDVPPAIDPPSPKVSGCILCTIFRSPGSARRPKPRKH